MQNTKLIDYGIHQEEPDTLRMHVSIKTGRVYVFQVGDCLKRLARYRYPTRPVYTGNIKTANGYIIPPFDIPNLKSYDIPPAWIDKARQLRFPSTPQKGDMAVAIVKAMLKTGQIPIMLSVDEITDETMQIKGLDIIVSAKVKIQVKCDWDAGPQEWGGTGNLFIQIQECNPYRQH